MSLIRLLHQCSENQAGRFSWLSIRSITIRGLLDAPEFYGLGLGEYFTLSSMNGSGTGELLDAVV